MSELEERGQNALKKFIQSCAATAEGRKHVRNWSLHMKNANYGKRTGKPVSITSDISKLFPSSPSSSFENSMSTGNIPTAQKTGMELEDPISNGKLTNISSKTASANTTDRKSLMSKRLSGINSKVLSFVADGEESSFTDTEQPSLLLNGNQNGSFSRAVSSPSVSQHSSANDSKIKSKSIKRRLTFSEKKVLSAKEAEKASRSTPDKYSDKLVEKSLTDKNLLESRKNSSVVTVLNNDVTVHQITTATEIDSSRNISRKEAALESMHDRSEQLENKTSKGKRSSAKIRSSKRSGRKALKEINSEVLHAENNITSEAIRTDCNSEIENTLTDLRAETLSLTRKRKSVTVPVIEDDSHDMLSSDITDTRTSGRNKNKSSLPATENKSDDPLARFSDLSSKNKSTLSTRKRKNVLTSEEDKVEHPDSTSPNGLSDSPATRNLQEWLRKEMPKKSASSNRKAIVVTNDASSNTHRLQSGGTSTGYSLRGRDVEEEEAIVITADDSMRSNSQPDNYAENSPVYVCEEAANDDGLGEQDVDPTSKPEKSLSKQSRVNKKPPKPQKTVQKEPSEPQKTVQKEPSKPQKTVLKEPPKSKKTVRKDTSKSTKTDKKQKNEKKKTYQLRNKQKKKSKNLLLGDALPAPILHVPEPSPDALKLGLRRSKRARVRPLQQWNGEMLVYGENNELLGLQTNEAFQPLNLNVDMEPWMFPKRARQVKNMDDHRDPEVTSELSTLNKPQKQKTTKKQEKNVSKRRGRLKKIETFVDENVETELPAEEPVESDTDDISQPQPNEQTDIEHEEINDERFEGHNAENLSSTILIKTTNGKNIAVDAEATGGLNTSNKPQKQKTIKKQETNISKRKGRPKKNETLVEENFETELHAEEPVESNTADISQSQPNETHEEITDERFDSHNTENLSSTILIKTTNGESIAVDATQLIAIPENESAFGEKGQPWTSGDRIRFTKGLSTSQHAMGTIALGPGVEKGRSSMKTDTLFFFIAAGEVEISIGSAGKILSKNSYFSVPPNNDYNIKNISTEDAFLSFTQIKNRKPKLGKT